MLALPLLLPLEARPLPVADCPVDWADLALRDPLPLLLLPGVLPLPLDLRDPLPLLLPLGVLPLPLDLLRLGLLVAAAEVAATGSPALAAASCSACSVLLCINLDF